MVAEGALALRHDDDNVSAHRIVVGTNTAPVPLQIQAELAVNDKLCDTSAGQQLDIELGKLVSKLRRELDDLRSDRDTSRAEFLELQAHLDRVVNEKFGLQKYVVSIFYLLQ